MGFELCIFDRLQKQFYDYTFDRLQKQKWSGYKSTRLQRELQKERERESPAPQGLQKPMGFGRAVLIMGYKNTYSSSIPVQWYFLGLFLFKTI